MRNLNYIFYNATKIYEDQIIKCVYKNIKSYNHMPFFLTTETKIIDNSTELDKYIRTTYF